MVEPKTQPLTDRENLMIMCLTMRLRDKEGMTYMKVHGHDLHQSSYTRLKRRVNKLIDKRKTLMAVNGMFPRHLQRIDQLETIITLSWQNYHTETRPINKQKILESIAQIQPILSIYDEATQQIVYNDIQAAAQLGNERHIPKLGSNELHNVTDPNTVVLRSRTLDSTDKNP
jgi:hypothetical protein